MPRKYPIFIFLIHDDESGGYYFATHPPASSDARTLVGILDIVESHLDSDELLKILTSGYLPETMEVIEYDTVTSESRR